VSRRLDFSNPDDVRMRKLGKMFARWSHVKVTFPYFQNNNIAILVILTDIIFVDGYFLAILKLHIHRVLVSRMK
jgi:hypothetical protein